MRTIPLDGMLTVVGEITFCLNVQKIWCQRSNALRNLHNLFARLILPNIVERHNLNVSILTYFNLQI